MPEFKLACIVALFKVACVPDIVNILDPVSLILPAELSITLAVELVLLPFHGFAVACDKYGDACFDFQVIELVSDKTQLIEREQHYIDSYKSYDKNTGYNICPKAGSNLGRIPSTESRLKMSEAQRRRPPITDETRAKLSITSKGRKQSKEQIEKRIETRRRNGNFEISDEMKNKLRNYRAGARLSDIHKQSISAALNARTVEQKEETRRKKSESLKAMHALRSSEREREIGLNISSAKKGNVVISDEQRQQISKTLSGRKLSPQHCANIRAALRNHYQGVCDGR